MNGIMFNGTHSSAIQGVDAVITYDFPLMPDMENITTNIEGAHGAVDGGRRFTPRIFTIRFLFRGNGVADYFQKTLEIEKWLNVEEAKPMIFDVLPDLYLLCRPTSGVTPDRSGSFSYADVQFTAFDPFFRTAVETDKMINSGTTYTYEGSKEIKPKLTITFSASAVNVTVTDDFTGDRIVLLRTVQAGDILIIDNEKRIVTLNGVDVRVTMDLRESRWLKIKPPQYRFTVSVASTIRIEYRAKW